ncbi:efflux transporter outer membrane subunit [Aquibaculum arenosum]|uniref:Efflux transporter outer membrane subunit n=1 Tax=Aquibaculum arenosum TaxID=3032591 RepID=A0ABT5YJQ7_9PROT|nr:efflux transporter outer membrane subunit [Fodinicurvata sp. CAU 1616]MDF2095051.1 efflux transporter outer membrane subunit [Fodinicurvata sp. CAU 1616]
MVDRRFCRGAALALVLFALGACAMGPDYEAPVVEVPDSWPAHLLLTSEERQDWTDWWTRFEEPQLDALVARALDDNLDIRLQVQRLQEARAQLGLARAERLPTLEGQGRAARERQSEATSRTPIDGGPENFYSLSATLGYEVDFWGRLAREEEAAAALLDESIFSRDAVRLNVVADVVATYFNLRAAQQQLRIVERALEARERTYALEDMRYRDGETDSLTLRQAESELQATRARLPAQREQVLLLESALATLVGMTPAELFDNLNFGEGSLNGIARPEGVPAVVPSELLRRRPDIRAAEAGLVANNALIGVAEAERFPQLNLSAFLGTAAISVGDLFTAASATRGVGAGLLGPIFDFGRGQARVESAEARRDQAETQYRITLRTAFREVRDALITYDTTGERMEMLQRQVEALQETLRLAELRYREGFVGFIDVLDAQRALLEAELALTEAQRDRLNATTTLFKAMGGGWTGEIAEAEAE